MKEKSLFIPYSKFSPYLSPIYHSFFFYIAISKRTETVGKILSLLRVPSSHNRFIIVLRTEEVLSLYQTLWPPALLSPFSRPGFPKKEILRFVRALQTIYVRLTRLHSQTYTRAYFRIKVCSYSQHPGFLFGVAHEEREG